VKTFALAGLLLAALTALAPVTGRAIEVATLLTIDDYAFLASQGVERSSPVLQRMSPRELRRLHLTINDAKTRDDAPARASAVRDVLAEFAGNQQWEAANPGQLWDDPKRAAAPAVKPD
jgi:hypothetical protein